MTPEQDAWWKRRTGTDAETVERGGTFYLPDNTDGPYNGPPSRREYSSPVWKVLFTLALLLLFIVVRAVAERS